MSSNPTIQYLTKVKFKKEWFNPLYFILNNIIKVPTIRKVLIYGGKSSSKTVSVCQLLAKESFLKQDNVIAFRKESNRIKTTLKKSFDLALKTTRLKAGFEQMEFVYRSIRGSEILMSGLDDAEKAKGIESYKHLLLDELNHFTEAEFEQFDLSLRGMPGQKLFGTWNPVNENSWIKKDYLDLITFFLTDEFGCLPDPDSFVKISEDGSTILIKTTYLDNYWITGSPDGSYGYRDENLIKVYEGLKEKKPNVYRVNVKGEWGRLITGQEYYPPFNRFVHVGKWPYLPELRHSSITWDWNVTPYLTCECAQVQNLTRWINELNEKIDYPTDGYKQIQVTRIRYYREYTPKPPLDSVKYVASLYSRDHPIGTTMDFYGDAQGNNRIEGMGGLTRFGEVAQHFSAYTFNQSKKAKLKNISPLKCQEFTNDVLSGVYPEIEICIDESCVELIDDAENCLQGIKGKLKNRVKNPITKETYEEHGHASDAAFNYLLCEMFRDRIKNA